MRTEDKIIITNLYSLYQCISDSSDVAQVFAFDGFKIIRAEASAWPNMVYDITTETFCDDFVKSIKARMAECNAGPVLFEPSAERIDIYKQNGILPADRWVGMIKDELCDVDFSVLKDNIVVRNVKADEMVGWTNIVSAVLFGNKPISDSLFTSLPVVNNEYIGLWLDNAMIGTSMIHYDGSGTAGIYMVCVSEPYRGKGFGKILVEYCYKCIIERGGNRCLLQATQKGLPLYTSMGFIAFGNYTLLMKIR